MLNKKTARPVSVTNRACAVKYAIFSGLHIRPVHEHPHPSVLLAEIGFRPVLAAEVFQGSHAQPVAFFFRNGKPVFPKDQRRIAAVFHGEDILRLVVLQGYVQTAPVCRLPHVGDDGVFQHVGQQDRQVLFFHSQLRRQLYGMRNRYPLLLGALHVNPQRRVDDGVLAVRRQRGGQDFPLLRYNEVGGLFRFSAFNQRQQQPVIVAQVVTDAHDLFLPFPGEPGVIFQRVDALVHQQVIILFPVLFFRTPHQDHHKTVKQEYPEGQHQPGQMVVPVVDDPVVGQQHHVAEPQAQGQERHI